ncbi:MAG TPA: MBL fold metallo-hydrolase [Actinomycetota bacterium]|nr:MBL fold metallo-hydrolase [Actinomycetota bacterium]
MPDQPTIIDTHMHGFEGITGAFLLRGEQTALVETGPRSSVEHVFAGLESAGVENLDWIVVTHIHLDHAGAAGTIARRFPGARVAVHPVGAPHLVDPSKLWKSASRIYGEAMDRLWGGIDPIDEDRIRVVADGDVIDLGGRTLTAIETPGHASHHHAYADDATGILFTGDAMGVSPRGIDAFRPATPPPEFHLETCLASIERIRRIAPRALWLTHYGPADVTVDEACDEATDVLNRWAAWVRDGRKQSSELDEVTAIVQEHARAELENRLDEQEAARMEGTTSYRMNVSGYMRYFDKKEQAAVTS